MRTSDEPRAPDGRDAEGAAVRSGPAAAKAELRRRMAAELRALAPAQRRALGDAAAGHLDRLAARLLPDGAVVALYAATPTELETDSAAARLGVRHRLAYPRLEGERLVFHEGRLESLAPGAAGVREPPASAPLAVPSAVVVPGRAFDRTGHRLGRGGGHFDRALAALPPGTAVIGFCFSLQVVASVPVEPHDRAMDWIVTDEGAFAPAVSPTSS